MTNIIQPKEQIRRLMDIIERRMDETWQSRYAQMQQEIDNAISSNDLFPLSLSADREIPVGKQLVIDILTVESGVTFTISGRLHNLFSETTDGTVILDGTWVMG